MGLRQDDLDLLSALTAGLPDAVTYPSNPPELPIPLFVYLILAATLALSTLMLAVTWLYNRDDIFEGLGSSKDKEKEKEGKESKGNDEGCLPLPMMPIKIE